MSGRLGKCFLASSLQMSCNLHPFINGINGIVDSFTKQVYQLNINTVYLNSPTCRSLSSLLETIYGSNRKIGYLYKIRLEL